MPYICYTPRRFSAESERLIEQADAICHEYVNQGYILTLRQLYYQFVARGIIPNRQEEYKRLGSVVNDARLAGRIDWDHLEDRTRNVRSLSHWSTPGGVIASAAASYRRDLWRTQPVRVEVWVEKDALIGVFERVCTRWDIPHFSCRGYVSQSEMWRAAERFIATADVPIEDGPYADEHQRTIVFHFGDHDPSGIDMTRDMQAHLVTFGCDKEIARIERLALHRSQVEQYRPPPNPAKTTDARFAWYEQHYGSESWELDALEPSVLADLVEDTLGDYLDGIVFEEEKDRQEAERQQLTAAAQRWAQVREFLLAN